MNRNTSYALMLTLTLCACRTTTVREAGWTLDVGQGITIAHKGDTIASDVHAEWLLGGDTIDTGRYTRRKVRTSRVDDRFGQGTQVEITYRGDTLPEMRHTFRLYERYLLADVSVNDPGGVATNHLAPIVTGSAGAAIHNAGRRKTFVPFDNDAWIRYHTTRRPGDSLRSYEVTGIYDPDTREGVVIGAIEHDRWKNAVDLTRDARELRVFSGVADRLTRDRRSHGMVRGSSVRSATVMVGVFDDWREGMETYATLNATVAPPRRWDKAVPVGWNSWGALQFGVNPDNSSEVVDFMADSLMTRGFSNADGLVYTGLDSGWDSFPEDKLKAFADKCAGNGQVPCIYWTPFTDWAKNPERDVPNGGGYKYKDIYLYADGQPQELDGAWAIDPTHPAVRMMMEHTAALFRRCGYRYVKMDFMTHGRMEADSWHNPAVTTGTEAYNHGMQLLDSIFHDMYINLSISPVFPAQYAQSRRIACDAWNKIKDTEYTMNALSWSWWTDRVYSFNDADHVVLRDATPGENRARITSAVITGMLITGDDFSHGGDSTAKARAMRLLANTDIVALATGQAFRPLCGDSDTSEHAFVRTSPDGGATLAVFNYGDTPLDFSVDLGRLGMDPAADYRATELWSHLPARLGEPLRIPAKDVAVIRISPL